MSKRDRAARAKESAEGSSADSAAAELDGRDEAADAVGADEKSTDTAKELRPSGKRSARGRRTSTGATDGDTDSGSGSTVAVKERKTKKKAPAGESRNPFVRIWLFLTQVVAELKKVIWPTRREMITYTIVVLVFVIIMTAFISGLDLAFAKGVLWLFG
ncbi:preprotein translocase subunit SecE [Gordonia sp. zg691]|uniref:Protein translocase subunit SecE n=1 Tax=Gordonia jinghuaiqii TaxID=2758710 RepID=A0A7D7LSR2_9ACTN|nr:preprotein translocase subunit SecE [Gordonia jinghuaiqii]MBD0861943.1 preprotein translocase subunit SecE [Gordonia jinghuaiqii]MCR5977848.1 preprotein translocase subunit SecE [Gordonia jinghuaiqii]QMT02505.1 preprotein translocase subunit SecE [Gordonia jinghuaiqii]